ncbi:molybdenum cofactor biosynthesis protein MoaE [Microbacterium hominis]|uniref:molybdenum cofactor biosynthesis protein MoaE n=1 Tax=Microbacterium hominis TaxID=162426 RepID=UPI0007687886|nr:molybdenum cofactor biosynthesis protein MoaE [Microbacterium hominis]
MMAVRIPRSTDEPPDRPVHIAAVEDAAAGAVASFIGTVRDQDPDARGAVVALEYSAHPDAEATLHDIAVTAVGDRRAIVAVSHRIGRLEVGDIAVAIAVATPHRAEAFEVCREIIEAIKRELPVWKRQLADDGSAAWKGLGG